MLQRQTDNPAKVFISYVRKESEKDAFEIARALEENGVKCFIDQQELPGKAGHDYKELLSDAILDCDTVLSLATPTYSEKARQPVEAEDIAWEIDLAVKYGKRIIPVIVKQMRKRDLPLEIKRNQAIPANGVFNSQRDVQTLSDAINFDLGWWRKNSKFKARAAEWTELGKPKSHLLSKRDEKEGQDWLVASSLKGNIVAEETAHFLFESKKYLAFKRNIFAGSIFASLMAVVFIGLSIINELDTKNKEIAQNYARAISNEARQKFEKGDVLQAGLIAYEFGVEDVLRKSIANIRSTSVFDLGYCTEWNASLVEFFKSCENKTPSEILYNTNDSDNVFFRSLYHFDYQNSAAEDLPIEQDGFQIFTDEEVELKDNCRNVFEFESNFFVGGSGVASEFGLIALSDSDFYVLPKNSGGSDISWQLVRCKNGIVTRYQILDSDHFHDFKKGYVNQDDKSIFFIKSVSSERLQGDDREGEIFKIDYCGVAFEICNSKRREVGYYFPKLNEIQFDDRVISIKYETITNNEFEYSHLINFLHNEKKIGTAPGSISSEDFRFLGTILYSSASSDKKILLAQREGFEGIGSINMYELDYRFRGSEISGIEANLLNIYEQSYHFSHHPKYNYYFISNRDRIDIYSSEKYEIIETIYCLGPRSVFGIDCSSFDTDVHFTEDGHWLVLTKANHEQVILSYPIINYPKKIIQDARKQVQFCFSDKSRERLGLPKERPEWCKEKQSVDF